MSGDIWKEARVGNGDEGIVKKEFGTISENGLLNSYQNNLGQDQERSEVSMSPSLATNTTPFAGVTHCQTNNTGSMLSGAGNYQAMLDEHNEFKKIRKMCKEQASFAKEDQEAAYKNALYGHLAGRLIHPLPVRTSPMDMFPQDVFPQGAQQWIQDFAKSFSVNPCVAGTLLLGVLSISANGKFSVERHAEHVELMTLYNLIMMNSGKLKSPMLETAIRPLKRLCPYSAVNSEGA